MKKTLLLLLIAATTTLNAQVFKEYFMDAATGSNLEDYNDWYVSFKAAEANGVSPIIDEETLFYTDYFGSDQGKSALLDSLVGKESDTQRISTRVVTFGEDTLVPGTSGKMYAAFMVSILPNSKTSWRDFFTWEGSSGSSWTRGRVFAKVSEDNADLYLAVSKNSSSDLAESEVITGGVGVYHLLVLAYEVVEGDANDIVTLYINPDPTLSEDAQTNKLVNIDEQSDYSDDTQIKINLRQRGIGAKIGGIRVGKNWEEVLYTGAVGVEKSEIAPNSLYAYGSTVMTGTPGTVEIFDITGRKVMQQETNGTLETSLKSGIYIVRFQDKDGLVAIKKVALN